MKLLCFGDSNTYGYDPRSYLGGRYSAEYRWVDLLAQETGWEVLNAGQNGREIPHRSHALLQAEQLIAAYGPVDMLLVMLGDNDLLQGASLSEVLSRMETFLKRMLSSCSNLLLVAPPPMKRGAWVTEDCLLNESAQLAAHYQLLARKFGIAFVDAGQWGVELTFDGVHFTEAGHLAFAKGLCAALKATSIRQIHVRSPSLLKQLTALWEASVRATHPFLTEDDIQEIARRVPQALESVPHLAVLERLGTPVGFLGVDGERLEMLFLSPSVTGHGFGRQLLTWGIRQHGIREVCVNEQNPQARGFYEHLGFRLYKYTELDEQGRPFPLLYLRLEDSPRTLA